MSFTKWCELQITVLLQMTKQSTNSCLLYFFSVIYRFFCIWSLIFFITSLYCLSRLAGGLSIHLYENQVESIFNKILTGTNIFLNRDVLRHDYIPDILPHRDEQINRLAGILAPALNHSKISNVIIYGKTGTGKTAVSK